MKMRKALTAISLASVLAACGGGGGGDSAPGVEPGPPAPGGPVTPPPPVLPGDPGSVDAGAISESDSVSTEITAVEFNSPLTITFALVVNGNQYVTGLSSSTARFTLAQLLQRENEESEYWDSYVNTSEDPICRDEDDLADANNDCSTSSSETDPENIPDGARKVQDEFATGKVATNQAIYERNGAFADNGNGTWSYTYNADPGDPATLDTMHRSCIQFSLDAEVINPCIDFVPADLVNPDIDDIATSLHPNFYDDYLSRQVVTEGTCNTCHAKLALHGNGRTATDYCVTCHNPDTSDANSEENVDLAVLAHRVHYARNLDSVSSGIPYKIWGFRNGEHDYSHVSYPQNVLNCTRCHAGQEDKEWMAMEGLPAPEAMLTTDGHNWAAKPHPTACLSCHEGASGHVDRQTECIICHGDNQFKSVREEHRNLVEETAAQFKANVLDVSDTAPGEFPTVTFSITDPTNDNAPYDLQNDPAWTQGGGASRLAIDLAWSTGDYTNTANESEMASAVSIDGLTATPVGDGSYIATSGVPVPDGNNEQQFAAAGSGAVGIEGHPAIEMNVDNEPTIVRIPMDGEVDFFSIDEDAAQASPRRQVVDMDKCLDCHRSLNLHGNNRSNNDQLCTLCHNPRNTDREVRDIGIANPPPSDGKDEESLDMKTMVHAIHASAMRENALQVVGFGGSSTHVYDEEHIQYPGDLSNCLSCHDGDSYALPVPGNVLSTTVSTGSDHESPADDLVDTPMASACASCHDAGSAKAHMESNGALFTAPISEAEAAVEACDVCHGNGASAGVNLVHGGLR